MELTEEQRERIRVNRERAFEIQKQRRKEKEEQELQQREQHHQQRQEQQENSYLDQSSDSITKIQVDRQNKNEIGNIIKTKQHDENINDEIEDWEHDVSIYVTKHDAKTIYCLPEGTISCCQIIIEKDNPKNKHFTKCKLYLRSEIRQRSYKRYGGLTGLQQERNKRQQLLHEKHIKQAQDIFNNTTTTKKKKKINHEFNAPYSSSSQKLQQVPMILLQQEESNKKQRRL